MARGRPRKFDEDQALNGAMVLFWQKGLSSTSLDELAEAMNMNRPSIYNAFGNKDAIYRTTLARFCGQGNALPVEFVHCQDHDAFESESFFNPCRPAIADDIGSTIKNNDFIIRAGELCWHQDQAGIRQDHAGRGFNMSCRYQPEDRDGPGWH